MSGQSMGHIVIIYVSVTHGSQYNKKPTTTKNKCKANKLRGKWRI